VITYSVSSQNATEPSAYADFHEGKVTYHDEREEIGVRWALPDEIVKRKTKPYELQCEWRLFVSTTGALKFENAGYQLVKGERDSPRKPEEHHDFRLTTKSLGDICKLHEFRFASFVRVLSWCGGVQILTKHS
jgi:hypothetical protein